MIYERKSNRRVRGLHLRLPKIKRLCLNCEAEFMALGRFNRICPRCTQIQRLGERMKYYQRYRREQEEGRYANL